jgi:hypothetical protein
MAKKDKTPKVPKKVAGVKVPKDLRKSAKSALKLAQNPIAREVISAALVAGAAALAKRRVEKAAPEPKGKSNPDVGAIIAQGVAAFVSGLGKPAEKKSQSQKPEADDAKPKPGSRTPAG